MTNFFPIYSTFESSYRSLLSQHPLLAQLHVPALERSSCLQHDLAILATSLRLQSLTFFKLGPGENVSDIECHPLLDDFINHIRDILATKPHLIVAYTWVFYMAIFSGGRYIRAQLQNAGNEFWNCTLNLEIEKRACSWKSSHTENSLTFWDFAGASDGENLKAEYKAQLLELETCLTAHERHEITDEAEYIMCKLPKILHEIRNSVSKGNILAQPSNAIVATNITEPSGWSTLLVKHLLPLGMAELLTGIRNYITLILNPTASVAVTVDMEVA